MLTEARWLWRLIAKFPLSTFPPTMNYSAIGATMDYIDDLAVEIQRGVWKKGSGYRMKWEGDQQSLCSILFPCTTDLSIILTYLSFSRIMWNKWGSCVTWANLKSAAGCLFYFQLSRCLFNNMWWSKMALLLISKILLTTVANHGVKEHD